MQKLLLITLALLFFLGCSDRERANPFDPLNPVTHGAPVGIKLRSNRDTIFLSWDKMVINHLLRYSVYWAKDTSPMESLTTVPPNQNFLMLTNCDYDTWYRFSIAAVTKYDVGTFSKPVKIMPGPSNLIVADFYDYSLRRISYDGNYVYDILQVNSPIAICSDLSKSRIFVASYWENELLILNKDFSLSRKIQLDDRPLDLEYNPDQNELLILVKNDPGVLVYSGNGEYRYRVNLELNLTKESSMALDTTEKILWIASPEDRQVSAIYWGMISKPQIYSFKCSVSGKIKVANRLYSCWIPTDTGLVLTKTDGTINQYQRDSKIRSVSVDPNSGICYFVGLNQENRCIVGKVIAQLNQLEILISGEYPWLYEIQVIPGNGRVGIFVVQTQLWRLLRFNEQMDLIGELKEFSGQLDYLLE